MRFCSVQLCNPFLLQYLPHDDVILRRPINAHDGDVTSVVVGQVEMTSYLFISVVSGVGAMFSYTTFHGASSLPHILHITSSTGDEIYDIVGLASHVLTYSIGFSCGRAGESCVVSGVGNRHSTNIRMRSFVITRLTRGATTSK